VSFVVLLCLYTSIWAKNIDPSDLHIDGEPDDNILDGVEALVGASSPIVVRDDSPMEISTPPPAPAPAPIPLSSPPSLPPLTPTSLLSRSRFKEGKAVRATPPFVSEEDKAKIDEAYRALNASSGKGCNRVSCSISMWDRYLVLIDPFSDSFRSDLWSE
jgi:hypothetical protein